MHGATRYRKSKGSGYGRPRTEQCVSCSLTVNSPSKLEINLKVLGAIRQIKADARIYIYSDIATAT